MNARGPSRSPVRAPDLRAAFHALIRRFGLLDADRTPCGQPLAVSCAHALMEILHRPQLSQGELAVALGLSASAVSRMVAQFERRGWILRRGDAKDGRVRHLVLTALGRRHGRRIDQASLERFSAMLAGLPPAARGQVISILELLHRAIPVDAPEQRGRGVPHGQSARGRPVSPRRRPSAGSLDFEGGSS